MENCSFVDPWFFRPEPWISDVFAFENAALTKALQISISESSSSSGPPPVSSSVPATSSTVASPEFLSASTSSSSSPPAATASSFLLQQLSPPVADAAASRCRNPIGCAPTAGRVAKRKSRASKRSTTTYINADPANFREMVQRVTGVQPESAEPGSFLPSTAGSLVKPEPYRAAPAVITGERMGASFLQQICLPTLDTSAFLLDRALSTQTGAGGSAGALDGSMGRATELEPCFELEQMLPVFPTLESWGVM